LKATIDKSASFFEMPAIKITKEDRVFSQYIRKRDKRCARCKSFVRFNDKKLPVSHNCSHFITRGNESLRFDEDNCICLCYPCHQKWGGDDRDEYKAYMIKILGRDGFNSLLRRSTVRVNRRKIREWAYTYYKIKLKKL